MTKSKDEENVCASAQVTRRPLLTIIKKAGLKYFQFDLISQTCQQIIYCKLLCCCDL